jgi:6-phosphofructokinase 1
VEILGIRDGFGGFFEAEGTLPLTEDSVRGLIWRGGSILGCNNLFRGDPKDFAERARELGLEGLIVVGGEGSLTIAAQVDECGMPVVGVPKTIDNDVCGTEVTFGFDTAVGVVAEACNRLITTAESHHRLMIVEVMGRHSGFIALHGAIAGSAAVALIPEIPYRIEPISDLIGNRNLRRRPYTLIVIAEGAKRAGGTVVLDRARTESTGREHLGGAGALLAEALHDRVPHEIRHVSLGHLQRGGTPTPFDRVLGTRMGVEAVRAIASGARGVFTAVKENRIVLAPISEAAGKVRYVDPQGPLVSSARGIGMSLGD